MATLNRRAAEAAVEFGARAATDITGFGFLGHATQMADASRVSMVLRPSRSWFLPRVLELAKSGELAAGLKNNRDHFGSRIGEGRTPEPVRLALYDPQTSGGLLLSVPARKAPALIASLKRRRTWVAEVGEVVARGANVIELA
jgi:selenide,water dikinase